MKSQITSTKIILFLGILLLTGCHGYMLDDAQDDLRRSFSDGDMEASRALLNKFEDKDIYRGTESVLMNLESGMVHHFSGNYDSSFVYLNEAEQEIEANFTKSVSRGIAAMLVNDTKLEYDGEPYEDVYINAFNALNFIHQGDLDGALVESRRMSFKMEQMEIRLKGIAEAFSKRDTTGKVDWQPGELNVQDSPMAHYLAALIYAKTGKQDDARIEFERLQTALNQQRSLRSYPLPSADYLSRSLNANSHNILITAFSGQSPVKYQNDIRLYWDPTDSYLKFSFPSVRLQPSSVDRVVIYLNGERHRELEVIEEMDKVAYDIYKAKEPVIYARALFRTILKSTGTNALARELAGDNGAVRDLIKFAGFIGMEATEKADLRGWQTLPGKAWMDMVSVPVGTHEIDIQYLNASGKLLYAETFEFSIADRRDLLLLETIYSY